MSSYLFWYDEQIQESLEINTTLQEYLHSKSESEQSVF